VEVVVERKERTVCKSILSIPISQVPELDVPPRFDWSAAIVNSALAGRVDADPILVTELSAGKDFDDILSYWLDYLKTKFKAGELAQAIDGQAISEIPSGVLALDKLDKEPLRSLTLQDTLKYFPLFLNHSRFNKLLAEKALEQGFANTAPVFLYIGATFPIANIEQQYCASELALRGLNHPLPMQAGLFPSVGIDDSVHSEALKQEGIYTRILLSEGGFKLIDMDSDSDDYQAGVSAFSSEPPDIFLAEASFLAALERGVSADVCNMLGRCLSLNKNYRSGAIFLIQASLMDPFHPYAAANLVLALDAGGFPNDAQQMAAWAASNSQISEWGFSVLKKYLEPDSKN
jgi:hypothetical protein